MLQVLIPTSGFGSRLGELTEHMNKALVPVGAKPTLTHIIESYPPGTKFLIMLGHKGDLVREYLTVAHPDLDVVYLDHELEHGACGLVGALQKQPFDGPFIFHASDTIADIPDSFLNYEGDSVLAYPIEGPAHDYRLVRRYETIVDTILEKGAEPREDDLIHIGVVKFADPGLHFWDAVHRLDPFSGDTHLITAMQKAGATFGVVETPLWLDTGNMSCLKEARDFFGSRDCAGNAVVTLEKTDQAVYFVDGAVIKFFANADMAAKRVERAKKVKGAPEITHHTTHFFAYDYFPGKLARDAFQSAEMVNFLDWCQKTLWNKCPAVNAEEWFSRSFTFYSAKTERRLAEFFSKTGLVDQSSTINNVSVPFTLAELVKLIDPYGGIPCVGAHGDLHFSNVLIDNGSYRLIDWREDFGGSTQWGDVYYDLGKLLHGLIVSHDIVAAGGFKVDVHGSTVTIDIQRHQRLIECEEVFRKWVKDKGYDLRRVYAMCGLIFVNIAPLHHYPYNKFLFFLGKKILHETLIQERWL